MMPQTQRNRTESERLYIVENNIEHINQNVADIKKMIQEQNAKEKEWLTKFQADMIYAKKETEIGFQSLRNDFQKIFWGALAGLVAVIGFFIKVFFFNN